MAKLDIGRGTQKMMNPSGKLPISIVAGSWIAVTFSAPVHSQIDCTVWNTPGFFKKATASEVSECIDKSDAGLNSWNDSNWLPIHNAAAYNHDPEVTLRLIGLGADPNAIGNRKSTPLHMAAEFNDNPLIVETLIAAGADPNAWNGDYKTPLHLAVQSIANPAAMKLADSGNLEDSERVFFSVGNLPAKVGNPDDYGDPSVLLSLLQSGANPNEPDIFGETPLHLAGDYGNPVVIQMLLEYNADPAIQDHYGRTP